MNKLDSDISKYLDYVIKEEEYHRDRLLFFKKQRQRLERLIDTPQNKMLFWAAQAWKKESDDAKD